MPLASLNFSNGIFTSAPGSVKALVSSIVVIAIAFMLDSRFADGGGEGRGVERVHHVAGAEPPAPRRQHAVAHEGEVVGVVRVGRDYEFRAARLGCADHGGLEVEPFRAGVD